MLMEDRGWRIEDGIDSLSRRDKMFIEPEDFIPTIPFVPKGQNVGRKQGCVIFKNISP